MSTIFTKIRNGEIPSVKLYSDDMCFVILDVNPVSKGHALVIANEEYNNIASCPEEVLSHMMEIVKKVDKKLREVLKCEGTNVLINNDVAAGQSVPHLHIHVVPRYKDDKQDFGFFHVEYKKGEMQNFGSALKLE